MNQDKYSATEETQDIIDELLDDGSDPDAIYLIEHHISSSDFSKLEKVAVEAFKLGFEATDPEEIPDENIISCDIISEMPLDADLINQQIIKLVDLATQFGVQYDGWGTYFEDGELDDGDYEYDEDDSDEEPTPNSVH